MIKHYEGKEQNNILGETTTAESRVQDEGYLAEI